LLETFADQAVIAIENVRLFNELETRNRELTSALDTQTATSDILRVISRSQTNVQPVFDAILASAARLLRAYSGALTRLVGDQIELVALTSTDAAADAGLRALFPQSVHSELPHPEALRDRAPINITDTQTDLRVPEAVRANARARGYRSWITVPLLRYVEAVGTISVTRRDPGGFTDDEIALLQTFADQAVIAIENVRLFKELETRNRELTEALEQQTATSEILRIISSSPTDLQPVFDTIVRNAVQLCGAAFGGLHRLDGSRITLNAQYGIDVDEVAILRRDVFPLPLSRESATGRAILDRTLVHIRDIREDPDYRTPRLKTMESYRTILAVPLIREGIPVGALALWRPEVRPFSEMEIGLIQTFADQAVIAVENVRLFTELQEKNRALTEAHVQVTETLEQQTATAEILRVIASSPTDLRPVMEAVAENAARVCGATDSVILRLEGEHLRLVAQHGSLRRSMTIGDTLPVTRDTVSGRVVRDRRTIHVEDIEAAAADFQETVSRHRQTGSDVRTMLVTPLLREGTPLGVIAISRGPNVRSFSAKQIALLETFANQAVIAIENVRLFTELEARTQDLTRSVSELRALGDVGRALSSTLDLDTVLQTIVTRASQLAGTDACSVYEYDAATETFHLRATHNLDEEMVALARRTPTRKGEGVQGRMAVTRQPVQILDIAAEDAYRGPLRDILLRRGIRALLAVPLLREDELIGGLTVNRKTPGAFAPEVIELLQTFATQSALAVQNARLFREIADKSQQLEAASRHKSEFLANMSHELRTPLNAILGFSEVLAERMFGEVNAKQAEYLQDILGSGRHLLSLINDILDLSKVEAGRLELERGRFHLPTALGNALTLIRERATRHGITLDWAVDERVGDIVADERKIKQILLNLLSNAVKFTPEGGRVGITAMAAEGVVTISVSDTGVGIAPEDQAAIFEEFRQVGRDDARKQEGTGLGLTLAKKFVELHGGRIWVESTVGTGSTFTFSLPVGHGE
jgi:GAF domain-containing protein